MTPELALIITLILSIAGILFSGILSIIELRRKSCNAGRCGISIFGLPTCVYGCFFFLIILIIAIVGLKS